MSQNRRLIALVPILLAAFWLRIHNLDQPELNIDESWSFLHSYFIAFPSEYPLAQILAFEPNNDLHLIAASGFIRAVPNAIGLRSFSVFLSMLTVALTARAAARLFGRLAVLPAGLLVAVAYAPVTFAQIGRPYALSVLLALLSVITWLEGKWRLNLLVSAFVPLAHVGAMPVVMAQDFVTVWRIRRGKGVNVPGWLVNRISVYSILAVLLAAVHLRRVLGKVMSAGQSPPTLVDILRHWLDLLVGDSTPLIVVLFLAGVIVPTSAALLKTRRTRRALPENAVFPLTWIACTYAVMLLMAVVSDGPIKWVHISHVAVALVLLLAWLLTQIKLGMGIVVLLAFCALSLTGIARYYAQPDKTATTAALAVAALRQDGEVVYVDQGTVLWWLQLNVPDASYLVELSPNQLPERYLLLQWQGFLPPPTPGCTPTSNRWNGFLLLECVWYEREPSNRSVNAARE